ncbi:hypothetical protein BDZ88DRAFT_396021 [Geranomyces variabilis]|nr:hypothetical protein BDZ88DRAFT_396021 [Geranomyces variabilis]KAJ3140638.1 hypothetical protein HDU90_007940 [Geranomyces variabilis]
MGRTNPLALRLRGLVNWPGNVRHQLLSNYVKHLFQHTAVSEPHVRASTVGIWINVSVLSHPSLKSHPTIADPVLDFRNSKPLQALGRVDRRVDKLAKTHFYYRDLFKGLGKNPVEALGGKDDPLTALAIYRDTPINLRVNVVSNPLLDAQVCANYIVKQLEKGKPMNKIYRDLLTNMG